MTMAVWKSRYVASTGFSISALAEVQQVHPGRFSLCRNCQPPCSSLCLSMCWVGLRYYLTKAGSQNCCSVVPSISLSTLLPFQYCLSCVHSWAYIWRGLYPPKCAVASHELKAKKEQAKLGSVVYWLWFWNRGAALGCQYTKSCLCSWNYFHNSKTFLYIFNRLCSFW